MTHQQPESDEQWIEILLQKFYIEAQADPTQEAYGSMVVKLEAQILQKMNEARIDGIKIGVHEGWNASAEGYNAEYAGLSSNDPAEVEAEIIAETVAALTNPLRKRRNRL